MLGVGLLLAAVPTWADTTTFTENTTIDPNDFTYDGDDIVVDGCIVTINGVHAFNSLHVTNNGTVTHAANADAQVYTLDLTIATDVTVDAGSKVDVNGRGYSSSSGPGEGGDAGTFAAGAGYGGAGADSTEAAGGSVYGSITQPTDLGSGGGRTDTYQQGGPGGGVIHLNVAGALTINGDIIADGANGTFVGSNEGGGGSGGSVYLEAATIAGSGAISANGGDSAGGNSGGGGGGRIALYFDTNTFAGPITAIGGGISRFGGAGTVYFRDNAQSSGVLRLDNGGNVGAGTFLTSPEAFDLVIGNGARGFPEAPMTIGDLTMNAGAEMSHSSGGPGIDLTVQGDATIDPNAVITVTGRGYSSSSGLGEGGDAGTYAAGAGYGGAGANSTQATGGAVYGSLTQPTDLGSGGGRTDTYQQGGPGGGVIHLNVAGALTINGDIIADGANGTFVGSNEGGGGSGGSVYLEAATIAGSGAISANGGDSAGGNSGGGGGGRIAIYHDNSYSFSGTVTACGGGANRFGGAGTVYVKSTTATVGDLYVNNAGNVGAYTDLPAAYPAFGLVEVNSAGVLAVSALATLDADELQILNASNITHRANSDGGIHLNVVSDMTVDATSKVDVTDAGYPPRTGPGAGGSTTNSGGGGGYGGPGGYGSDTAGGVTYGSFTEPTDLGSGGGEETDAGNSAGHGGGAARLSVGGMLAVEGELLANGGNGVGTSNQDHAGGSGGSIWIDADTIGGAGSISAVGGSGNYQGGGGGGGRVAIYSNANTFVGTVRASGTTGNANGGAGTVYIDSADGVGSALYIDNWALGGAETDLPGVTQVDNNVIIRNQGVLTQTGDLTITGDLTVEADGVVTQPAEQPGAHFIIGGDVSVEVDGAVDFSSRGYAPRGGAGAGVSTSNSGGGGGYGGTGGVGSDSAGGVTYGSITAPTDLGSGGGEETDSSSPGGHGGGAVRLSVTGALFVEGDLLANGGNGTGSTSADNGGGAGGSIWIDADTISGAGQITANGGAGGGGANGGGGGGGRIAIYTNTNAYAGVLTTCGASGHQTGGAGTIYIDSADDVGNALILDNCGADGAETDLPGVTLIDNNLVVSSWGELTQSGELTITGDVLVTTKGRVRHPIGDEAGLHLIVSGDLDIDPNAYVTAADRGYAPRQGPGAGGSTSNSGGGGGYGGVGGDSPQASGGDAYGYESKPFMLGSGGGEETDVPAGGRGGGALRLSVDGTLTVNGTCSVRGASAAVLSSHDNGGGSGGGLFIEAATLDGAGVITANGGDGYLTGGGGGGRIAVYTCDQQMPLENITATGGVGWQNGDDGTIFFGSGTVEITQQPVELVVVTGDTAQYSVVATGDGTLSYQWRRNGVDLVDDARISGAQTDTLTITSVEFCDIGGYDMLVTDNCGGFPSDTAWLSISDSGDLDGDADVDLADLAQLLANFNTFGGATWDMGDLNDDGNVDLSDLAGLLAVFGTTCE